LDATKAAPDGVKGPRNGMNWGAALQPLDTSGVLHDGVAMMKLCNFVGTALGGYAGWFLGDRFGCGVAFVLSGVGRLAGVCAGWTVERRFKRARKRRLRPSAEGTPRLPGSRWKVISGTLLFITPTGCHLSCRRAVIGYLPMNTPNERRCSSPLSRHLPAATALVALLTLTGPPARAADAATPGSIAGSVFSKNTRNALQGAVVTVPGLNRSALTDAAGQFLVPQVPAGTHEVTVSYEGFDPARRTVAVPYGDTARVDIEMQTAEAITMEAFTVATVREG
jgi:hypothetical protein